MGIVWDDADEEVYNEGKMCTICNRTFAYFPKIGVTQSVIPENIEQSKPKEKSTKKNIKFDFEEPL